MKVRFENFIREKCEECGKPAKWRIFTPASLMLVPIDDTHYYCDKCVKEK